jgi:hypothetical protein
VTVEMNTLSVQMNMMATFEFIFEFQVFGCMFQISMVGMGWNWWQEDGKIKWDYSISSVPVDLYSKSGFGRYIIEIFCVIFLVFNCFSELKGTGNPNFYLLRNKITFFVSFCTADILWSLKNFRISSYLMDIWNLVDWTHFIFMWVAWATWLGNIQESNSFFIAPSYRILASPATETRARLFETDPEQESRFLAFSTNLRNRSRNLGNYVNLTTICGVFQIDYDVIGCHAAVKWCFVLH